MKNRRFPWHGAILAGALLSCDHDGESRYLVDAATSGSGEVDASVTDASSGDIVSQPLPLDGAPLDALGPAADGASPDAFAGIVTQGMFSSNSNPCGLAFDHTENKVWVYPCNGTTLLGFLPDGTPSTPLARGGEVANDVDVDVAPSAFMLGEIAVSQGDVLFINGETETTEIYVINKTSGASDSFAVKFGNSHVVGGAYHAARNTFFLVQDKVPGGENGNRIAEIDVATGEVILSFQTTPNFVVNYGDLDVCQTTGNLLVVSSDENAVAEFGPTGTFLRKHPLPAGVTGSAGIDINDATGEAWISGTNGAVRRLSVPCPPRSGI